jgi:hypothetical protein
MSFRLLGSVRVLSQISLTLLGSIRFCSLFSVTLLGSARVLGRMSVTSLRSLQGKAIRISIHLFENLCCVETFRLRNTEQTINYLTSTGINIYLRKSQVQQTPTLNTRFYITLLHPFLMLFHIVGRLQLPQEPLRMHSQY